LRLAPFPSKTDKSKRRIVRFGRKVLTDKKSGQLFLGLFSIQPRHSLPFCLGFLAVRTDLVGKCWGGELGWSEMSIPCQKLRVRYYNTLTKLVVHANRDQKITKKSFRPSWCQQEALIMRPLAVAAMASAARANCPDCWPEGCRLDMRRRRITTAPQLHLMLMTVTVAKLKSMVSARATATAMAL
jgi:hypothetical protein